MNWRKWAWIACFLTACAPSPKAARHPRRVLVMVLDQFRPDYVRRLQLPNLQRLEAKGAVFENAWVGHLPATTVVSHEVLPRGRVPARLAWGDDLFHDIDGLAGVKGRLLDPGELSLDQMKTLLQPHDRLHIREALPGGRFLAVGQKRYAVFAMAGAKADIVVTFSETLDASAGAAWEGWARPDGQNVPESLIGPPGSRFWVNAKETLGTQSSVYKLGGYKYAPMLDSRRSGGDAWVADAAMRLMESGDWRLAMLTFGAVDRVGHMFGAARDLDRPNPHLPFERVVRFADAQVGRVLDFLHRKGYDRDTLVVVTADHGGLGAANWQGEDRPDGALDNWMWGDIANVRTRTEPRPALAGLVKLGLRAAYTDTMLRLYLHPQADRQKAADAAAALPGVVWVGVRVRTENGFGYAPAHDRTNLLDAAERTWLRERLPILLRSYTSGASPDVLALLDASTSWGQPGDHGGAQREVQRIPLILSGPGISPRRVATAARLVDIAPTVWELAAGHVPAGFDGVSLAPVLTERK